MFSRSPLLNGFRSEPRVGPLLREPARGSHRGELIAGNSSRGAIAWSHRVEPSRGAIAWSHRVDHHRWTGGLMQRRSTPYEAALRGLRRPSSKSTRRQNVRNPPVERPNGMHGFVYPIVCSPRLGNPFTDAHRWPQRFGASSIPTSRQGPTDWTAGWSRSAACRIIYTCWCACTPRHRWPGWSRSSKEPVPITSTMSFAPRTDSDGRAATVRSHVGSAMSASSSGT